MAAASAIGPGLPAVCPGLVDRLADPATKVPDRDVAFVLAVCSAYSYGDVETVASIMDRLGLTHNRCAMVSEYVDALFLTCTAFVIQSEDGRVAILCYRGTPPTSVITWMTDFQVAPVKIPMPAGRVHGGFYRNVRSTRRAIAGLIDRAMAGHSILDENVAVSHPLEALYVTGHSLGGASAAMFAALLEFEPAGHTAIRAPLRAVYTYGAPMIGDPDFARECRRAPSLNERVVRYVYAQDIVPRTPPRASGPFAHFGREFRYRRGRWVARPPRRQLSNLLQVATTPISLFATAFTRLRRIPFHASLGDHFPQNYIDALTPPKLRSEFGE